jgi:two-component system, response regulator, stage 0 sporulation protein F
MQNQGTPERSASRRVASLPGAPTVLVADDDDNLRALVARRLSHAGYVVLEASSGGELLDRVVDALLSRGEHRAPDFVIADVNMPGGDGLEALRALARAHCRIPFVIMTGFPSERVRELSRELGAAAIFEKPLDLGDLETAVRVLVPLGAPMPPISRPIPA